MPSATGRRCQTNWKLNCVPTPGRAATGIMAKTDTSTLVLCDDTWHPAAIIRRGLAALGDCDFAFEFMEDGEKWSADAMKKFPLVVLAKANISSSTVEYPWLTLESQAVFPDYVQLGNGLLVILSLIHI